MTKPHCLGLRLLSLVLCLVCLMPLLQRGMVVEAEDTTQLMTTAVHSKASGSSSVIGQMADGIEVSVLGTTGSFYKVDCYDMTGYIAKAQIEHTDDGKYYVNCTADSKETGSITQVEHGEALTMRHSLRALAQKQLGSRYVHGSARPGAFDCSGLTSYLYAKYDIGLHRSASAQMQDGIIVAKEGLQVGDLVFFRERSSGLASHVGIYVGDNEIIHASSSRGVRYSNLDETYYRRNYLCARRVVNTAAAQLEEVSAARVVSGQLTVSSISGRTVR